MPVISPEELDLFLSMHQAGLGEEFPLAELPETVVLAQILTELDAFTNRVVAPRENVAPLNALMAKYSLTMEQVVSLYLLWDQAILKTRSFRGEPIGGIS
jgi:hypothetical protein